jgi:hypothetical protein
VAKDGNDYWLDEAGSTHACQNCGAKWLIVYNDDLDANERIRLGWSQAPKMED